MAVRELDKNSPHSQSVGKGSDKTRNAPLWQVVGQRKYVLFSTEGDFPSEKVRADHTQRISKVITTIAHGGIIEDQIVGGPC